MSQACCNTQLKAQILFQVSKDRGPPVSLGNLLHPHSQTFSFFSTGISFGEPVRSVSCVLPFSPPLGSLPVPLQSSFRRRKTAARSFPPSPSPSSARRRATRLGRPSPRQPQSRAGLPGPLPAPWSLRGPAAPSGGRPPAPALPAAGPAPLGRRQGAAQPRAREGPGGQPRPAEGLRPLRDSGR